MLCLYYALRCSFDTARSSCDTGSSIRSGVWVISKRLRGCGLVTAGGDGLSIRAAAFETTGALYNNMVKIVESGSRRVL